MKKVPVLITTNQCPKCRESEVKLKNANLPYKVGVVPLDEEALKVAQNNGIMNAGSHMYLPDNLDKVFLVDDYLEGKVDTNDNS